MSQRLDSSTILDGVNLPRHPYTGMLAIGVLPSGRIVWPIAGASDDNNDDDNDSNNDDDTSGGDDDNNNDDNNNDDGGDDSKGKKKGENVTREEFDRLFSRMQAADRRATDAEKRLREIDDKDKSELEKAQRDLQEANDKVAALEPQVREQAIRLAFLTAASHITWHDPEDALQFAMKELKDVEVVDGQVDRATVKKAADKLAKEKQYLVKSSTDSGGDDGKDGKGGRQPSGDAMNGGRDKDKRRLDREKLAEKFPALRR